MKGKTFIVIFIAILCSLGIIFSISKIIDLVQANTPNKIKAEIHEISQSTFVKEIDRLQASNYPLNQEIVKKSLGQFENRTSPVEYDIRQFKDANIPDEKQDIFLRIKLLNLKIDYISKRLDQILLNDIDKPLIMNLWFYIYSFIIWVSGIILNKIINHYTDKFILSIISKK